MPIALTHADLVLPEEILRDSALVIDGERILAIDPDALPTGCAEWRCEGLTVAPGLIDLHCDAVEKISEPRPGAAFPREVAMDQTDRVNALAGITTVYHAISFGQEGRTDPSDLVAGVAWLQGRSLVDHRLHCRYEIACEQSLETITRLVEAGEVGLISIMDHSPGQGQFKDIESFCAYYTKSHGLSHDEALALARRKHENRTTGHGRALELTELAGRTGIPVASHDDDSPERVAAVRTTGVSIAEFPITLETARAAHAAGLPTILGAPNVLRGGSQSGSMRALDAVVDGCCDCLCSDYAPWALLPAAWSVSEQADLPLSAAWQLVSAGPAAAAGLDDRGVIAVGLRADLVAIDHAGPRPRVVETWTAGRPVQRCGYPQGRTAELAAT